MVSAARDTADPAGANPLAASIAGSTDAGAPSGHPGMGDRGEQPHRPSPAAAREALWDLIFAEDNIWMGDGVEGPRSPSPTAAREASLSPAQQEAAWAMAASGRLPAVGELRVCGGSGSVSAAWTSH